MDMLAKLTESLHGHKNSKELIEFANKTWQQLEQHAAESPESYKEFQKATMSVALNTAPPDPKLAQRKPSLTINTSIEASTASLLISTAPVIIHVFRAAPSFAATMSGKTSQNRHQQGTRSSSVPFKVRWQSGKLIQNTKEQVTMHVDCPAKQVDTVLDAALLHAQGQLLEQVLSFVEQREGVKLARRAAEVSLPAASGVKIHKTGRLDDPAPANSAASRLPASLVSKLTLVPTEDVDESCISKLDCTSPTCSSKEQQLIPAGKQPRRPLIQEVVSP